jgi:hypothetical protein
MIVELNIRHYEQLLTRETDPSKRKTIAKLLAEEKAKLLALQREDQKKLGLSRTGFLVRPCAPVGGMHMNRVT